MPMLLYGNGTISGATTLVGNISVAGYANVSQGLSTVSRGINSASVPSGSVVQVVHGEYRTTVSTSSAGTLWSGVSITPNYSTSKILILGSFAFGASNLNGGLAIYRNGAAFMPNLDNAAAGGSTSYTGAFSTMDDGPMAGGNYIIQTYAVNYLDSPSTTSTLTYSLYCTYTSGGAIYLNRQATDNGGRGISTFTLMEIAQ